MEVCMLLDGSYPPDIRIEKEASALLDAGHTVTLLCRGRRDEPEHETLHGMGVVRMQGRTRAQRAAWLASGLANLVTGVYPRWVRAIRTRLRNGADAVHVHDLPFVRTALVATLGTDVPVMADLHENYPEAVRQWRRRWNPTSKTRLAYQALDRGLMPVSRLKRLERSCVARADEVVTVCEEAVEHYVADCDGSPERVHEVSNTVRLNAFDSHLADAANHRDERADRPSAVPDGWVVVYVGRLGVHRGLETVVEAFGALGERVREDATLLVVGPDDNHDAERLRPHARSHGVDDRLSFTGWVDLETVPAYIAHSDVGLVPHLATPHTATTVPHKLFQYMAAGRPVLVTDVAPLKRIVSETGSGVVTEAGDPQAMAAALRRLYRDRTLAETCGRNGRRAVEDRYNWGVDGARLCQIYGKDER